MTSISSAALDLKRLDILAKQGTSIHLLDARAKTIVTFGFILAVISFDRYEVARLIPFFIFPAVILSLSSLPSLYIIRKIAIALPFLVAIGIFNPLVDHETLYQLGHLHIAAGWFSFASIILRGILTAGAALILVGVTGFNDICLALERLGIPQIFVIQMLFMYRYLFVLVEEGERVSRGRELRSFGTRGFGSRSYISVIGHLIIRTWERAERIRNAMLARSFVGEFHAASKMDFGKKEWFFVSSWLLIFILLRFINIPERMSSLLAPLLNSRFFNSF